MNRPEWDGTTRHRSPGVTGYRKYGCRCPECESAGAIYRAQARARDAERRFASGAVIPPVDWDDIAYLKPGAGVQRRKRP